jgi:hypothetical protein
MKLKDFLELYDNWNGTTKINDDNLETIVIGNATDIFDGLSGFLRHGYSYSRLWNKEVVAFGFYDNELCIRVR